MQTFILAVLFSTLVLAACSPAEEAGGTPPAAHFEDWVVEKWEDDAVQVKVEDGQLRVDTQSKLHGAMLWLKRELPDDLVFEYDFTPLADSGFFLIFCCQKGTKGEDILSEALRTDHEHKTLFKKYTMGRDGYHISYRRDKTPNCNLRKNAGQKLLKQEPLTAVLPKDKTVHVKLTKQGGHLKLEVGGTVFMEYEDKNDPYAGGRIGLRQVYESSARYDNVKLTALKAK